MTPIMVKIVDRAISIYQMSDYNNAIDYINSKFELYSYNNVQACKLFNIWYDQEGK